MDDTRTDLERYEKKSGRDLSRIVFYETFARFKVAVVIQQIYFRYVRGQTKDERFRNFDCAGAGVGRDALELAERSGISKKHKLRAGRAAFLTADDQVEDLQTPLKAFQAKL